MECIGNRLKSWRLAMATSLAVTQSGPALRRSACSTHFMYCLWLSSRTFQDFDSKAGYKHRVSSHALLQLLCGQTLRLAIVRVPPAEAASFILAEADRQSRAAR